MFPKGYMDFTLYTSGYRNDSSSRNKQTNRSGFDQPTLEFSTPEGNQI